MKLVTFLGSDGQRLGAFAGSDELVVDLRSAYRSQTGEEHAALSSMQSLIDGGPSALNVASATLSAATVSDTYPVASVKLLAPLPLPLQIRDCLCFEEHLTNSIDAFVRRTGREPPPRTVDMLETMRKQPIWYKANRFSVAGPDQDIRWPRYSSAMDYELEMAMVLGRSGRDVSRSDAPDYIFGYMIFNDLSARDTQAEEMTGGLGPTKGKDFDGGNVFGPCLVTTDEFDPGNAAMIVRVNGEVRSEGNSAMMRYRFEDLIAYISRDETLHAGEILCSGTVGGGCGLEQGRLLESGDLVELEIAGIGVLRNRILTADAR